jgi:hypothetical protein
LSKIYKLDDVDFEYFRFDFQQSIVDFNSSTTRQRFGEKSQQSLSLSPLTEDDQRDLMVKYWKQKNLSMNDENVNETAQELITKLANVMSGYVATPHEICMIAELYSDGNLKNLNDFDPFIIYEIFVKKIILNWRKKGGLSEEELDDLITGSTNVMSIHHNLAINFLIGSEHELYLDETLWTKERIARVGIATCFTDQCERCRSQKP